MSSILSRDQFKPKRKELKMNYEIRDILDVSLRAIRIVNLTAFLSWQLLFFTQEYLKEGVCNLSIDEAVQVGTDSSVFFPGSKLFAPFHFVTAILLYQSPRSGTLRRQWRHGAGGRVAVYKTVLSDFTHVIFIDPAAIMLGNRMVT